MTPTDTHHAGHGSIDDAVASITGQVARRLTARYVPLYAAVAVMLLVAAVAPSRVDSAGPSDDFGLAASNEFGQTGAPGGLVGDTASMTDPGDGGEPSPPPSSNPSRVPDQSDTEAPPEPAASSDPGADPTGESVLDDDPGDFAGDPGEGGGFGEASACPVEFGQEPEVSRGVAGVLLSAASPALSLLGPFGPNAVPALGVASPLLPVVAPAADKFAPYIRLMNPLFLQVSELGTTLWQGPLQPLESPLLQLNATVVQPFEVELLAALSDPIDQVNGTPVTPCLQRLVYNLVTPLPIPTP